MPRAARLTRAGLLRLVVVCAAMAGALPAIAQEVTLRDGDGPVAEGELLGYDGRYYRLIGPFGEITLDGADLVCDGEACPGEDWVETLRMSGEAALLDDVLPPLFETYAARRGLTLDVAGADGRRVYDFLKGGVSGGRVVLYPTSSAEGIADIVADAADLAVSLRRPSGREADLARAAGRGDLTAPGRSAILALDAIVPIVSVANPVTEIEVEALAKVLTGEIADWSDLGGTAAPIRLHLPSSRTGFGEALARRLSSGPNDAVRHGQPEALAAAVADDPRALGLALLSAIGEAQPLRLSDPCGTRGGADALVVKTQDYPLSLPIFLYAPARRLGNFSRDLVDYLTSPLAQPVIRRAGFIDQFPEAIAFAGQGERLARGILSAEGETDLATLQRMVSDLEDGARLTLSFRFEAGSTMLDAQSAANVSLLAEAIERGVFAGRELVFAGFSDGLGPSATNRVLSRQRALAVRDAVDERLGPTDTTLSVGAYGEALPMACDETAWGRHVNRRVEVWLK